MKPVTLLGLLFLFGVVCRADGEGEVRSPTVLGLMDQQFTINGSPAFLVGFSYYGALGASGQTLERDLDAMREAGFNWLRVWATWDSFGENVSAVNADGTVREFYLRRLRQVVAECNRRGMVVDVTLARGERKENDAPDVHIENAEAHMRAVREIVEALRPLPNWYLDLANERDVRDDRFVSVEELGKLRERARELNPSLLVTASFGGHDLTKRDVADVLQVVGADFLAVHRPRHAGSPQQTAERTREVLTMVNQLQFKAPVHHQEPFRRGYARWEPTTEDFLTDLRGAMEGGAAGWCFHNGATKTSVDGQPRRSFDLRQHALIDQLDSEERQVVRSIRNLLTESAVSRED